MRVAIAGWEYAQTISDEQLESAPGYLAGVLRINVRIPPGITPGSAVPVYRIVGSAFGQFGVTIAVSGN